MEIQYIRCGDYYIPDLKLPEEKTSYREMGPNAQGISERTPSDPIYQSGAVLQAVDLSGRSERTSLGTAGKDHAADERRGRYHRSIESG